MSKHFTLQIVRDEEEPEFYCVTVKELPGCFTQGRTIEECISRALEAIVGFLESEASDGNLAALQASDINEVEVGFTVATAS
jgi:predicted RNase H-like HicB family nuclease